MGHIFEDEVNFLPQGLAAGGGDPAMEPEAVEVDVAEDEEGGGDFECLARHGAVGDERAAVGEGTGQCGGGGSADGVETNGYGRGGRGTDVGGCQLAILVEENLLCSVLGGGFCRLGAADDVEGVEAEAGG